MHTFMENFWVILLMSGVAILVVIFCYQLLRRSQEPQSLFMKGVLFVPRIISNLFHALTMDEKGYSLKKILAVFGTGIAGKVTIDHANLQNCITFVLIWLAWAGILVGIYSFGDLAGAFSKIKGNEKSTTNSGGNNPA